MPTTIPLEIETPVGSPELAPSAFATASMRAELTAREAAAHPAPLLEMELPATLSASVARLREINALAPTDKSGRAAKASQLATMAAHVHRLSQGAQPPRIDHTVFFKGLRTPHPAALAYYAGITPAKAKSKRG
jgi:hypothetical protein